MVSTRKQKLRASSVHHLLPSEIMFDIFSRLPLEALYQSLFVCKDWKDIIKNEDFVDFHHSRDSQSFLMLWKVNMGISWFHLFKDGDPTTVKTDFHLKPVKIYKTVKLVGAANGLACLSSQPLINQLHEDPDLESFYICNPLTREVLKLPRATTSRDARLKSPPSGFAYDATSNTYKVIHTLCFREKTVIEIFVLGGSKPTKWKNMPDLPPAVMFRNKPPVFCNGALHWETMFSGFTSEYSNCVAAIDVGSETFRTFKLPLFFISSGYPWTSLFTLRDRLCVAYDFKMEKHIEIWSMTDYGQSWSKQYTIDRRMLGPLNAVPFQILETSNNGQLFFLGAVDQGYYDPESKKFRETQIPGLLPRSYDETRIKLYAVVHHGSLVSPKRIAGKTLKTRPQKAKFQH